MDIAGCDFDAEGAEHAESVLGNGRLWTRLRPSQDYGGQALDFGLWTWNFHIELGRYDGAPFGVEFGGLRRFLGAKSARTLAPRRFRGQNVKMGKAKAGHFGSVLVKFGQFCRVLALFWRLLGPIILTVVYMIFAPFGASEGIAQ